MSSTTVGSPATLGACFFHVTGRDLRLEKVARGVRLTGALPAGGQLAVQMPANVDHPPHTVADAIGADFGMTPLARFEAILAPERYALLLDELGFAAPHVCLQVYVHRLPSTAAVITWGRRP